MQKTLIVASFLQFLSFSLGFQGILKTSKLFSPLPMTLKVKKYDAAVIVGSGPTGLATGILLVKKGFSKIKIYDKLPRPPMSTNKEVWNNFDRERSYNIGLSGRGQRVLQDLGVLERIDQNSVALSRNKNYNSKKGEFTDSIRVRRTYPTKCIERDRLCACLIEEIEEKYKNKIKIEFNTQCSAVEWINKGEKDEICKLKIFSQENSAVAVSNDIFTDNNGISLQNGISANFTNEWEVVTPLLIGCDGSTSAVRDSFQHEAKNLAGDKWKNMFDIKYYNDKNVRVYRTIPIYFPDNFSVSMVNDTLIKQNYSVSIRNKGINLEALPTVEGVHIGVILFRPDNNQFSPAKLSTVQDAKEFFENNFPMVAPYLKAEYLDRFAKSKNSKFPRFQYCGPNLHMGKSAVLLGDSIHCVKPYFGLGVNSAFEDIGVFSKILDENKKEILEIDLEKKSENSTVSSPLQLYNIPASLEEFTKRRAKEAKALVKMSKRLDGGFLTFVLPIIMDGIFNKLFPFLFNKNTISLLQDENLSFTQVKWRKRIDRFLQIGLISIILMDMSKLLLKAKKAGFLKLSSVFVALKGLFIKSSSIAV